MLSWCISDVLCLCLIVLLILFGPPCLFVRADVRKVVWTCLNWWRLWKIRRLHYTWSFIVHKVLCENKVEDNYYGIISQSDLFDLNSMHMLTHIEKPQEAGHGTVHGSPQGKTGNSCWVPHGPDVGSIHVRPLLWWSAMKDALGDCC